MLRTHSSAFSNPFSRRNSSSKQKTRSTEWWRKFRTACLRNGNGDQSLRRCTILMTMKFLSRNSFKWFKTRKQNLTMKLLVTIKSWQEKNKCLRKTHEIMKNYLLSSFKKSFWTFNLKNMRSSLKNSSCYSKLLIQTITESSMKRNSETWFHKWTSFKTKKRLIIY